MNGAAAESAPVPRPFEFSGCIELREITRHLREYISLLARLVA
jgi:hypothetical protein